MRRRGARITYLAARHPLAHAQPAAAPAGDGGAAVRRRTRGPPALGLRVRAAGVAQVGRWPGAPRRLVRALAADPAAARAAAGLDRAQRAPGDAGVRRRPRRAAAPGRRRRPGHRALAGHPRPARELGIPARRSVVIPHGPFTVARPPAALRTPGDGDGPRELLFFGKIRPYKGVDILLRAFAALPPEFDAHLTVVGECGDKALRDELADLADAAGRSGHPVTLRLDRVPEPEVTRLLEQADAMVLPYRHITTSGSGVLALCHGRPLVMPDLPGLAELPGRRGHPIRRNRGRARRRAGRHHHRRRLGPGEDVFRRRRLLRGRPRGARSPKKRLMRWPRRSTARIHGKR